MGQAEINSALSNVSKVSLQCFKIFETIGKGGFSKVFKAEFIKSGNIVAIKQMNKMALTKKHVTKNILKEKQILSSLYHPFIVNMYATFQDQENVYIVMDYGSCGDFSYQLRYIHIITEDQIKFFAACVILGLEYIHSEGIIHRDVKPENIICDEKGYLKLGDFGIAKIASENENYTQGKYEICGTPGFISPEIVNGNCRYESDFFSLGVMLYEIILGKKPFISESKKEMINEFNNKKVVLTRKECNDVFSEHLCDFISKLIEIDYEKRLGRNGINEIKSHPFFEGFNWKQLFYKKIRVPWIPRLLLAKKTNSSIQQLKLRKKSLSKESKDTNDSDDILKNYPEFNDFDFIRQNKLKYLSSFYNNKLIHNSIHNFNSINNHSRTKHKKTYTVISPGKSIINLNLTKNTSSPNIQLFQGKYEVNHNYSISKQYKRSCSVTKNNKCDLPNISLKKDSFSKQFNESVLHDLSKFKVHKIHTNNLDSLFYKKEFPTSVRQIRRNSTNNSERKAIMLKKFGRKNSYALRDDNMNISKFILGIKA